MCLIIDTSRASDFFSHPWDPPHGPLSRWLSQRNGVVVYGGLLREELERIGEARRVLKNWERSGRAIPLNDEAVRVRVAELVAAVVCVSNDPHVVAVAQLSGARVLFTNDNNLVIDFRNSALVKAPPGQIYRTEADARHLRHTKACGRAPRK